MKKEKKVRTYQRRTKTGKLVTVKQHTAKYDAAEKAKEMLKKKGAGDELSAKKAKPVSSAGELDFSQADFKAWYHWDQENDPKNPAALKVEKALKAKMGAKGYRKFFNDMSDSYSARGHAKAYKECSACGDKGEVKTKAAEPKNAKGGSKYKEGGFDNSKSFSQNFPKELRQYLSPGNYCLKKKAVTDEVKQEFKKAGFDVVYNKCENLWEPTRNGLLYGELNFSGPKEVKSTKTSTKSSEKTPSKVAERYANEAGKEKVIAFMESNYRCTYNKKTGKFDFEGANFGRGHTVKSRSTTMEDARKSYAKRLQMYNESKAKGDPYVKNHIRDAKRQGWFINIPSKALSK